MKKCPVCQTRFKDKTTTCRYCGVELEVMTSPSTAHKRTTATHKLKGKKSTPPAARQTKMQVLWKKYGAWAFIICFLIVLFFIGSSFLSPKKDLKKTSSASQNIVESTMETSDVTNIESSATPTAESALASNATVTFKAYDLFNKAFKLCPGGKCTYFPKAIESLDEAIQLKPDYAEAFTNRGVAYFELGQYQRAIEDYNESIRLKPQRAESFNNRGIAYTRIGQNQRAIEDFDQAILLKQNYAAAYGNRGSAYISLNQYQNAVENYNEAIRLKPDVADYFKDRGNAYLALGNKNMGCEDLNKACEMGKCESLEKAKSKRSCP